MSDQQPYDPSSPGGGAAGPPGGFTPGQPTGGFRGGDPFGGHAPAGQGQFGQGQFGPQGGSTNGMAIAALVCSLAAIVVGWFTFGIPSLLGVIFGIIGLKQARERQQRGRGLALAGIIVGGAGVILGLIAVVVFIAGSSGQTTY